MGVMEGDGKLRKLTLSFYSQLGELPSFATTPRSRCRDRAGQYDRSTRDHTREGSL